MSVPQSERKATLRVAPSMSRGTTMLDHALAYALAGWAVFPCHNIASGRCTCGSPKCKSPGKHPRTRNGFKGATSDESLIRDWWGQWPDANIGGATGTPSGRVVLDVDPRSGGDESLAKLEREHDRLPETVLSLTGGAGQHLLFRPNSYRLKSVNGKLGPGLDFKADGGYVVLPPSGHASGATYEWDTQRHPDRVQLADLPEWICLVVNGGGLAGSETVAVSSKGPGRHDQLLIQTMRDAVRYSKDETLQRALDSDVGRDLVAEGRRSEIERMVDGAYRKLELECGCEFTDAGNGKLFAQLWGDSVRYDHSAKRWLVWSGKHWHHDTNAAVHRMAKETGRVMLAEAEKIESRDEHEQAMRWARASRSKHRIEAMLAMAQSEEGIAINTDVLDSDIWLLNVQNGTLDLHSCKLHGHRPEDMVTHVLPVAYDADAKCPRWERFLREVFKTNSQPNLELISWVQRAVGYTLTGDVSEHCLFLLYGTGRNGKSTFLELLLALFADLSRVANFDTFVVKRNEAVRTDIARLRGARLVTSIENDSERRLSESTVKSLTGGDTLMARHLYGREFEFAPTFKLWLAGNRKPDIRGTDTAIWSRIKLIPFTVSFDGEARDPHLKEKLLTELPGILEWAVAGLRGYHQQKGLGSCSEVEHWTEAYREEQDVIGHFIRDVCVLGESHEIGNTELYQAYVAWCEGLREAPLKQRMFSMRMDERDGLVRDRSGSKGRFWKGIAIRS